MSETLTIEPLTAAAFAPFGDILEESAAQRIKIINENTTQRFDELASVSASDGGRAGISMFRATPRPRPIRIAMLEHHPLGSQAFLPASAREWLVVVAPGDADKPDESGLRCFMAGGWQGVNYHPGTWHHPLLVLEEGHDFWVIDRLAPDNESPNANLREYQFATPRFVDA